MAILKSILLFSFVPFLPFSFFPFLPFLKLTCKRFLGSGPCCKAIGSEQSDCQCDFKNARGLKKCRCKLWRKISTIDTFEIKAIAKQYDFYELPCNIRVKIITGSLVVPENSSASSKPTRICKALFEQGQTGRCNFRWVWSSLSDEFI